MGAPVRFRLHGLFWQQVGATAGDEESYTVFQECFEPLRNPHAILDVWKAGETP